MDFNPIFAIMLMAIFCATYFVLFFGFPLFFRVNSPSPGKASLKSILYIVLLSLLIHIISFSITDIALGNRILHAFGGGFLAFLMCWLVVRDTKIQITRFQFFVFSFLIVTALGVGNEILEFIMQSITGTIFAPTILDTWLDLCSNTVGALIAAACFVPAIGRKNLMN